MAGKEKKITTARGLNVSDQESPTSSQSPVAGKKRGRKSNAERADLLAKAAVVKRTPRAKRESTPARGTPVPEVTLEEVSKPASTPRSRKQFLEKELEDILENATGRNTPLDDRGSLFVPKSRPDEDTMSMRNLSSFLRARRGGDREIEDDMLSLRSLRVRKDDDEASVHSLPAKPKGRAQKKASVIKPAAVVKPKGRPKKLPDVKPVKKKVVKTKEPLKATKQPLRLQNKIGASRRSNILLSKKVRNAKIAVKRISTKKAILKNIKVVIPDVPAVDEETSLKENETVKMEIDKTIAPEGNDKLAFEEQGVKRRKLVRVRVRVPPPDAAISPPAQRGRKRKWAGGIQFDTTQSPTDASIVIVQPRPRHRMQLGAAAAVKVNTPVASPTGKVQPPLPSPTGLAGAVIKVKTSLPSPTASPVDENCTANGPSTPYYMHTVANINALKPHTMARGDWFVAPTGGVVVIQTMEKSVRNVSTAPQAGNTEDNGVGSKGNGAAALTPSPVALPSGSAHTPLSISGTAVTPSTSLEPALGASASPPLECSPSLTGSATDPSPADSAAVEEKPQMTCTQALPRIPVAKNVRDLLLIKAHVDGSMLGDETKLQNKPLRRFPGPRQIGAGERRASHDGSFGAEPRRKLRRSGSCERFGLRPLNVPQLGSEALTPAIKASHSSSSLKSPLPLIESTVLDPNVGDNDEKEDNNFFRDNSDKLEDSRIIDVNGEVHLDAGCVTVPPTEIKSVKEIASVVAPNPLRSADRKTYSKSVDNPESLLSGPRRRSCPEPKVINIITMQDGTRRGPTLAEELRHKLRLKFDSPSPPAATIPEESAEVEDSAPDAPPNPPNPPTPPPPPAPTTPPLDSTLCEIPEAASTDATSESQWGDVTDTQVPEPVTVSSSVSSSSDEVPTDTDQLVSKETILSALGLQSLKAAEEYVEKKREEREQAAMQLLLAPPPAVLPHASSSGTLKTVIKRFEKKGNGRMTYKASCSTSLGPAAPALPQEPDDHPRDPSPNSKEALDIDDDIKKVMMLIIPEKASSFSIHPQRVCSDVCTYCFGKFGLLDTPCHIAQLKDGDKRRNILETETHLTLDSCLCDACFRHVDKKANGSAVAEKKPDKRKLMVQKQVRCVVENCDLEGMHSIRRKSLLKLKRSLSKKLQIDQVKLDKVLPAHLIPFCNRHIYWVDYFLCCGICHKKLTSVHMYRVGPYVNELNSYLSEDGIPAVLTDKRFLCKLCQCYSSIRLKVKDIADMNSSQRQFHDNCRKRILLSHGIGLPDSEAEAEGDPPDKAKKVKKLKPTATATVTNGDEVEVIPPPTKATNSDDLSDIRAQFRTTPPTTENGFYKCNTTIQFTKDTRNLFYDLQRPYGNHSSFFRHMVMLEKLFRNGDLVLSRRAAPQSVKYINNVQNRLNSFDGVPASARPFTITALPMSAASTSSQSSAPTTSRVSITPTSAPPPPPPPPPPPLTPAGPPPLSPLTQLQSAVHNIGIKPDISISSVGSEPRKLTPKIQENLRALATRAGKPTGNTRAVILNRTVGGQKQSLVQVTTGGKTIHLTLAQFRRIQQMQLRKKQQFLEQAKLQSQSTKSSKAKPNGDASAAAPSEIAFPFPNIPKTLSVSVTKVDLTRSSPAPD